LIRQLIVVNSRLNHYGPWSGLPVIQAKHRSILPVTLAGNVLSSDLSGEFSPVSPKFPPPFRYLKNQQFYNKKNYFGFSADEWWKTQS